MENGLNFDNRLYTFKIHLVLFVTLQLERMLNVLNYIVGIHPVKDAVKQEIL